MRKQNNPLIAWLILGLISVVICGLAIWTVEYFFIVPLPNVFFIVFIVLGFFPALCAIFGLRFLGIAGFFGIIIGILWGAIHAIFFGSLWQYVFILDFLRIYSILIVIGCLAQLFLGGVVNKKKKQKPFKTKTYEAHKIYEV